MDEDLRKGLLTRLEADQRALSALYEEAACYQEEFDRTQPTTQTPWPFAILEWQPEEQAPSPVVAALAQVRTNTTYLRELVAEVGWPGRDLVGEDGADAAWLLLQHAGAGVSTLDCPDNRAFRRSCVPLLERAVEHGLAHPRHLAHTVDGIRSVEGEPPRYAVLSSAFASAHGVLQLAPGLDAQTIDEDRLRIGLVSVSVDLERRAEGVIPGAVTGEQPEPWPQRSVATSTTHELNG